MNQENLHRDSEVAIIILAAGSSSRMGQSKQMLPIEEEPLLLKTVRTALQSEAEKVVVVLGANESNHRKIIQHLAIEIVFNPEWQTGIGNSLKKGLQELLKLMPALGGALVMVCDQPLLTVEHLNALIQKFKQRKSPIVASFYSRTVGVPALFEKSLFGELLTIDNNSGAKKVIQQFKDLAQTIDFPPGAIDLDTTEDYKRFIEGKGD